MASVDGTVRFDAGGQARTLRFTTNALCMLEDHLGRTSMQIAVELDMGISLRTLRAMYWAGSGDGGMTIAAAGDLIDAIGITRARTYAVEAFKAAFPDESEGGGSGEGSPPVAAAG